MKHLFKLSVILLTVLTTFSCSEEDNLSDLENQSIEFEDFFDTIVDKNIKTKNKNNLIQIEYLWDKRNNTITILGSEEKEPSQNAKIKINSYEAKAKFQSKNDDKYQVSCSNGDKSWTRSCSGKWSCGSAVKSCLDEGGCAEVCKLQMLYYPPSELFILDASISDPYEVLH